MGEADDPSTRPPSQSPLKPGEAQLELALEVGRLGTWTLDLTTGVLSSSDGCKANYGRAPGDSFTYDELRASVVESDRERWQDTVQRAIADGGSFEVEYGIRWPDGSPHWVLVRGSCTTGADGRVVGMLGVSADLTEQRRASEALRDAQSRLEATLAAAEVGTWTWDVRQNRVIADRNLARLFGVSEDDARGGPIEAYTAAMHPDDRERVVALVQRSVERAERYEARYRVRDAQGVYHPVIARGQAEYGPDGQALRLPGVVIDVSREEQAAADLRANEERVRSVLAATGAGTWEVDVHSQSLSADSELRALHAYPSEGPIAWERAFENIHALDLERVKAAVAAAMAGEDGGRYLAEYRVVFPDGRARWIEARGLVSFDDESKQVGFRGTGVDVTARKEAEVAREDARIVEQQLRREAEEANRIKDEFLAMLGHELRNPLAPISTALSLMKMRSPGVFPKERETIERQVDHLTRLVDDLLDVSRIASGKVTLSRQLVNLAQVVEHAIELASPLLEDRRHHVDVSVPAQGLTVEGDPTRLAQAVANLLSNAAKYTEAPGGHIAIAALREGDQVALRVTDNGVGIEPEMMSRIFDMFVQERQSIDRARGGLGLGLTIVRTLIELHGGSVSAHSAGRDRGSELTIRLPFAPEPGEPVSRSVRPSAGASAAASSNARRVLIVDDNVDAADLLSTALEFLGHETRVAHDGPSALALVEEFTPDVAVLDIGLPVMDGYELGRRLRDQDALSGIRLIALTGYGQASDRQRSADAGFHFHLVKPVQLTEIGAIVAGDSPARNP